MSYGWPILSTVTFLPLVGALLILALRGNDESAFRNARYIALWTTLITFAISLLLWRDFDPATAQFQFVELRPWLGPITFHMGLDGISMPFVVLTTLLMPLTILSSFGAIKTRVKEFMIAFLVLETLMLGVFCSLDLIMFFVFWEVELIPMYLLISIWGTGRKEYSAIKFVLYTLIGSALMLAGILLLYFQTGTFDIIQLSNMGLDGVLSAGMATAIFFLIIFAFMVKLPVFPFHTWLPDAHTDAPTAVSVVLAGVLLKMGGYGMIRIVVGSFPEVAHTWAPLFVLLAVIGVIYGAALTLRQTDLKKLIAYSSVSHMGFVLLGIFALTQVSMTVPSPAAAMSGVRSKLLLSVRKVWTVSHPTPPVYLLTTISVSFLASFSASAAQSGSRGSARSDLTFSHVAHASPVPGTVLTWGR